MPITKKNKRVKYIGAESRPVFANASAWEKRVIGDAGRWAQTFRCVMNESWGI